MTHYSPVVKGPISYKGQDAIKRDIANLKAGLEAAGIKEGGWMNSVAPASCSRMANEYYKTEEELMYACADAMREEYKAIIDAGLIVQLDDPAIGENWDQQKKEPSVEGYRRYTKKCIDVLNHSIRGLPADSIRFHLCWGSWHGPHTTDIPMKHLVDLMLAVNANALFLRGRQRPPRARVEAVEGRQAARRQGDHARRRHPLDQPDRASRGRRRPDRALRRGGRPRQRRRLDRLRARRPRASADRLGEARSARAGRGARLASASEAPPSAGRRARPARAARRGARSVPRI